MDILKNIEAIIRKQSKKQGTSLNQLALDIELTEAGFYKMLKTGSIKIKTLEKIADALELPIAAFFVPIEELQGQEDVTTLYAKNVSLQRQIAILQDNLADKDKIIALQQAHMENQQQLLTMLPQK